MQKISVLHLIHTMAYGGVETAVINWLRHIDRSQFEVHLVCFANPGGTEYPFIEAAERASLQVDKISWGKHKPVFKSARELAILLRRYKVDVLHLHNPYADFVGAVVRWMVPVRTITTIYVWEKFDWKRNILQAMDRRVIRSFDMVTAHCENTFRKTVEFGFTAHRMRTLFCGYEVPEIRMSPEKRLALRRAMGVADDHVIIANIARLYPEKRQDFLLRCFKRLSAQHPNAHLWIAGVGPSEDNLRLLAAELGFDNRVRFLGFIKDLPELLPLVDIQVDPAMAAGVALAICSGMAAGLPIVAADVGGLTEVLKEGATGFLVPLEDERAYLDRLSYLIDNPKERARIGQNARHFIQKDYSLDAAVRLVEHTYRQIMNAETLNERITGTSHHHLNQ
jgi:glycosyltransferase involved in cell wall biosynthesis